MEKSAEKEIMVSCLQLNCIFEGAANIINVVRKIVEEGGISQGKKADEKTPVRSHNSQ